MQTKADRPLPLTKKQIVWLLVSIAVYFVLLLIPISGLSPEGQKALAILGWVIVALISNCLPSALISMIFAALIILTGVLNQNQFLQAFGTSPFFVVVGLGAVGMGMTRTKIGPRMSYALMKVMGRTPQLLLLAIMLVGFVIVALIVNIPALLAVCPVILSVLKVWSGAGGGLAFISSSATAAAAAEAIDQVSAGAAAVSYGQWAMFGVPIGLIMILPAWIFLCKWFKLGKTGKVLPREVVDQRLKELGKMDAEEVRYIVILVTMILFFWVGDMLWGIKPATVAIIYMGIMIMPRIGLITFNEIARNTNWDMCIQMAFFMGFAGAISSTGLGDWLANTLFGWFQTDNLFLLMLITILIAHIGNILVPGAGAAVMLIPSVWAISVDAGYATAFLPMVMFHVVNWTQLQPIQPQYLVVSANSGGYLTIRDFAVPNVIITVIWTVIFIPAAWLLAPLAGLM